MTYFRCFRSSTHMFGFRGVAMLISPALVIVRL
jgi:hypothetical protein